MSTTQDRLASCREAIRVIEEDGQETRFEGSTWRGADIEQLYARERELMRRVASENAAARGEVGGLSVAVPEFL